MKCYRWHDRNLSRVYIESTRGREVCFLGVEGGGEVSQTNAKDTDSIWAPSVLANE